MSPADVRALIAGLLQRHGFVLRHGVLWTNRAHGGQGFLGLSASGGRGKCVEIAPTCGVRYDETHSCGVSLGAYFEGPTSVEMAVSLSELGKHVLSYPFAPGEAPDEVAHACISDIVQFGGEFYDRFATRELAMREVAVGWPPGLRCAERFVPLSMALDGDVGGAQELIASHLSAMDTGRGTGKQYLEFSQVFKKRFTC